MLEAKSRSDRSIIESIMDAPIHDLGSLGDRRFANVLAPVGENNTDGAGVTEQFLENAEIYHRNYFDIDYSRYLVKGALEAINPNDDIETILDIGSGSGPSVFALLAEFPASHIVATDVSPNLLAILQSALVEKGKTSNCTTICLDLNKPWFKKNAFDFALGSAILHHLFEPERLITEVFAAVRQGGAVAFFEPFEPGYAIVAMIYRLIRTKASNEFPLDRRIYDFFGGKIPETAQMRCEPKDPIVYANIDDKWMFTKSHFEDIGRRIGASKTIIYPINFSERPFVHHIKVMLRLGLGLEPKDMSPWAWDIVEEIESALSSSCKRELLIEGCVAFVK